MEKINSHSCTGQTNGELFVAQLKADIEASESVFDLLAAFVNYILGQEFTVHIITLAVEVYSKFNEDARTRRFGVYVIFLSPIMLQVEDTKYYWNYFQSILYVGNRWN